MATTIDRRYILQEKLGEGGMGEVYRVKDRLTDQTIALKRVTVASDKLQFASRASIDDSGDFRLALAQEFHTLASLRHPNIISVLDYGFDEARQPYFTMELLKNAQTLVEFGNDKSVAVQLELLIQLAQALAYLHRRGVIHRDLKPDNAVVVNGQVKVLDFGLAVARENRQEADKLAGTLAYMAPEILQGDSATEASDLYAVGMIAYELFAGRHPFKTNQIGTLIDEILNSKPDIASLPVDQVLKDILEQLLSKKPEDRTISASGLVDLFAQATGQSTPNETPQIRESYLQAAQFVGRDVELEQLNKALSQTIAGEGSAWLIGGESGVGKSRLLDELRSQALVKGALVLRGQSIAEGGAPYLLWRDAIRRLCLQTELSDLEAGVLKSLVPDIGNLIGKPVADAPDVDPQAAQSRLMTSIEAVFQRQSEPIVILLEDLQWAGESLTVLQRLTRSINELSLLIVANYRNDERPDLPTELPKMHAITLPRLNEKAIAELSTSMLGENGRQPQVIELLQRETEGNIFFIVEVMRALAEEAGQLANIGNMTLPRSVFTGGVQTVVQRRLSRVPAEARALLQTAAVAGRELDLRVLKVIMPDADLEVWLNAVSMIVDVQDNRYRFAHDKLREGLLQNLPEDRRHALHKTVAQAIASTYLDDPKQFAILYYHWEQAQDLDCTRHYAELGGEEALKNSAASEALRLLTRAIQLQPAHAAPIKIGRLYRLLGEAHLVTGNTPDALDAFEKASALLKYPFISETATGKLVIDTVYQFMLQLVHRFGFTSRIQNEAEASALNEAMAMVGPISRVNLVVARSPLVILNTILRQLNWSEKLPVSLNRVAALMNMSSILFLTSLRSLSPLYGRMGRRMAQKLDDPYVHFLTAQNELFINGATGKWQDNFERRNKLVTFGQQTGNGRVTIELLLLLAGSYLFAAEFPTTQNIMQEIYRIGLQTGDLQAQRWGLHAQSTMLLFLVPLTKLDNYIDELEPIMDPDSIGPFYLLKAASHWWEGNYVETLAAIRCSVDFYDALQYVNYLYHVQLDPLARMSFNLYEKEQLPLNTVQPILEVLIKLWKTLANLHPVCQPGYGLYRGLYAYLHGQPQQAFRYWDIALKHAQNLRTPYYEARIRYEIGRRLLPNDQKRGECLSFAATQFERIGANWDLQQTNEAIADSESNMIR